MGLGPASDGGCTHTVPVVPVVATLGISFMVYRAALYSRIQYITAALLGNQTPRDSSVLEIGVGGGKNLYYYPVRAIVYSTRGLHGSPPCVRSLARSREVVAQRCRLRRSLSLRLRCALAGGKQKGVSVIGVDPQVNQELLYRVRSRTASPHPVVQ